MNSREITLPCPTCSGTHTTTHEDRHTETRMDICPTCKDEGTIPARSGESPEASFRADEESRPVSYSGAPMPPDGIDGCVYCGHPFNEGDLILPEMEGGEGHVACMGPDRDGYVGADGEPLKDGEPIPTGYPWEPEVALSRAPAEQAPAGEAKSCHWGGGNDILWCSTCGAEYAYAKGEARPECPKEMHPVPGTVEPGSAPPAIGYGTTAAQQEAFRRLYFPNVHPKAVGPVGEESLRGRIARTLYEHHNRGLRDCWAWDADGLEAEHPGTHERYERMADAILPLVAAQPTPSPRDGGVREALDVRPQFGCPTAEPSIRMLVHAYYARHFSAAQADEMTGRYLAALSAPGSAGPGEALRQKLGEPFMTATSGDDNYYVKMKYKSLGEMQRAHTALVQFFQDEPTPDYTAELLVRIREVIPASLLYDTNNDMVEAVASTFREYVRVAAEATALRKQLSVIQSDPQLSAGVEGAQAAYEHWHLMHNSDPDGPLPGARKVFTAGWDAAIQSAPIASAAAGTGPGEREAREWTVRRDALEEAAHLVEAWVSQHENNQSLARQIGTNMAAGIRDLLALASPHPAREPNTGDTGEGRGGRPIEVAPKDRTILLYGTLGRDRSVCPDWYIGKWSEACGCWSAHALQLHATLWADLPTATPATPAETKTLAPTGCSKWGPSFPPTSCNAFEDCAHDGVCHDFDQCQIKGPAEPDGEDDANEAATPAETRGPAGQTKGGL